MISEKLFGEYQLQFSEFNVDSSFSHQIFQASLEVMDMVFGNQGHSWIFFFFNVKTIAKKIGKKFR